ncbi:histidine kinase [Halosquirtibacter laminarini]|uniref:Histidine kinase n=1 Tax=Halosquirtibacter laminarini TaxID=3374600 RepID=A0AC61NMR9_9BACT|nr:histidine kinase [Prolixibacteraceae bacterium]
MKLNKYLIHIGIWMGLVVLRLLAGNFNNSFWNTFTFSILLYSIFALIFYSTVFVELKYFEAKKHLPFYLSLIGVFLGGTVLLRLLFIKFDTELFIESSSGIRQVGFVRVGLIMLFALLYSTIVKNQLIEQQKKTIMLEKTQQELEFLKVQINPHFFFNTLNNIYGLTYQKDDKAPEVVLKLSEAMRYIIYETKAEFVPLSKELRFIENYIELESLRLTNKDKVSFNNEIVSTPYKITPLILLSFIENCFKHSDITHNSDGSIEINIWEESSVLNFSCSNTYDTKTKKMAGGIGSQNAKKRLDLIYTNSYQLETELEGDKYFMFLKLPLKL